MISVDFGKLNLKDSDNHLFHYEFLNSFTHKPFSKIIRQGRGIIPRMHKAKKNRHFANGNACSC